MEGEDTAVAAELSAVAATVAGHVPELSSEIWALLTQDIPELRGDQIVEKLLDASIEENVATLLHVFEHGLVPDEIRAPPAAVEYARRLAQRGVSTIALIRSYRVGHGRFLSRCIEQLASRTTDAALNAADEAVQNASDAIANTNEGPIPSEEVIDNYPYDENDAGE